MIDKCQLCDSDKLKTLDAEAGVVTCLNCGFVFNKVRPSLDEIKKYYSRNDKYDLWLKDFDQREALWSWRLNKVLRHYKKGSILDVSAGIGQFLNKAKKYFDELAGTEISKSAINISKERFGFDLLEGTIHEIDFKERKFDNITMFHTLEHVMNPRDELVKASNLLVSGGMLFVSVPNDVTNLKIIIKKLLNRFGFKYKIYQRIQLDGSIDEIHLSHFKPQVLTKLLAGTGFKIIEVSLDKYFISTECKRKKDEMYFRVMNFFNTLTKINLYDTIWVTAQKI